MEKQRIYDEIISVSISNAGAERQRNGICLIRDFDPDNPRHMLYYEASLIYSSIINEPLYLNMSLWKYIKFKLNHWKSKKQLKYLSHTKLSKYELSEPHKFDFVIASADTITNYIAKWANKEYEINSEDFDKIYGEVYRSYDNVN